MALQSLNPIDSSFQTKLTDSIAPALPSIRGQTDKVGDLLVKKIKQMFLSGVGGRTTAKRRVNIFHLQQVATA